MVKELMHDPIFLARKSEDATGDDLQTARDLVDTLEAHRETCVGMAANMIGVCKRIIVFDWNGTAALMLNPEILKASGEYETEEGCLSSISQFRRHESFLAAQTLMFSSWSMLRTSFAHSVFRNSMVRS